MVATHGLPYLYTCSVFSIVSERTFHLTNLLSAVGQMLGLTSSPMLPRRALSTEIAPLAILVYGQGR